MYVSMPAVWSLPLANHCYWPLLKALASTSLLGCAWTRRKVCLAKSEPQLVIAWIHVGLEGTLEQNEEAFRFYFVLFTFDHYHYHHYFFFLGGGFESFGFTKISLFSACSIACTRSCYIKIYPPLYWKWWEIVIVIIDCILTFWQLQRGRSSQAHYLHHTIAIKILKLWMEQK